MKKLNKQSQAQASPTASQKPSEVNPDGVDIHVTWDVFVIGASVFIPALNISKLTKQMSSESKRRNITLVWAERIEGKKLGVRFWRVL